jgi:hypothetical protein
VLLNTLVIIGEVFGMHHQLGGSTEDDMNKMSVIGHISLFLIGVVDSQILHGLRVWCKPGWVKNS